MKKIAAMLLCFCLLCISSISVFAQTVTDAEEEKGAVISATVPDSHKINITADHAQVIFGGKDGDSFSVERLSEPRLLIRPDNGYRVTKVTLNGKEITNQVLGGYCSLSPIYEDKALVVETEAVSTNEDSTHDMSGSITDKNGDPIPGATVDIGGHTDIADENGNFSIKDVPDGRHPVTVTDDSGNIIAYTEIEVGEGEMGVSQNGGGGYTLTAPQNTALSFTLTVTEDGKLAVDQLTDITPQPDGGKIPQTGEDSDILLWVLLISASAVALATVALVRRSKKA